MSYLLKIVDGPNKGAEIALVDGVAVTFGKGDECDIVLADPTMPDEPLSLLATADGVTVGGEPLEQFHVTTRGATSFAVGPADAPWGELVWPKADEPEQQEAPKPATEPESPSPGPAESPDASEGPEPPAGSGKRRGRGCGCIAALVALLLVVLGLAWFFRESLDKTGYFDRIRDSRWTKKVVAVSRDGYARTAELISKWTSRDSQPSDLESSLTLPDIAAKYGLSLSEEGGSAKMSGNLKTRRERLAATAEAYAVRAGVELDLSDDESLRASAEDALFTIAEGALKVSAATNRTLCIVGRSPSPAALKKTLEALNADMPRLRGVDVSGVAVGGSVEKGHEAAEEGQESGPFASSIARRKSKKASAPSFPVCGILTTPYPCLVMRDGRRVMEGALIGDSVIVEIGADSVTLTNSTGRFTWKP